MIQTVLGIDISKKDFHVVLMNENKTTKPKVFKNTPQGFESLQTWLTQQGVTKVHACMEATSIYGEAKALISLPERSHRQHCQSISDQGVCQK
jgi:transposase